MAEVFDLIEPDLALECLNCYQDLTKLTPELTITCRNGHSQLCYECMTGWRSECHNRYQSVTCPICRAEFAKAELAKLPEVVDKWMPNKGISRLLFDLYIALLHADGHPNYQEDVIPGYWSLPLYRDSHRYRYIPMQGSPRYDTARSVIEEVDGDRVGIVNRTLTPLNLDINTTTENIASVSTKVAITAEINRRERAAVSKGTKTTKAQLSEQLGLPVVSRRSKKRSRTQG